MDKDTLIVAIDFARARLLGSLDAIEKSGQDVAKVLAWRPGPGRAHIAWQAMHCAITHDRYLNVQIKGAAPRQPDLGPVYGGGSTPSDENIPSLATIRQTLAINLQAFKDYLATASPAELARKVGPPDRQRTVAESAMLMAWHESHHQGQIHLTWNLYKQAHGI